MEFTLSNRGFAHTDPVEGTDNCKVKVYESSAVASFWPRLLPDGSVEQGEAEGPFIWLAVTEGSPSQPVKVEAFAHLPLDAARQVRDNLTALIERAEEAEKASADPVAKSILDIQEDYDTYDHCHTCGEVIDVGSELCDPCWFRTNPRAVSR